jgi:hypothetical protein
MFRMAPWVVAAILAESSAETGMGVAEESPGRNARIPATAAIRGKRTGEQGVPDPVRKNLVMAKPLSIIVVQELSVRRYGQRGSKKKDTRGKSTMGGLAIALNRLLKAGDTCRSSSCRA